MNKILVLIIAFAGIDIQAQVAIGKIDISKLADTVTANPSISLEFSNTENRGLILLYGTDKTNIDLESSVF